MMYFKVKPEYDGKRRYRWNSHRQGAPDGCELIANELYTPGEFRKLANCPEWFEQVNVPRNKVYVAFGARFAG